MREIVTSSQGASGRFECSSHFATLLAKWIYYSIGDEKVDLFEEQNEGGDLRLPPGLLVHILDV